MLLYLSIGILVLWETVYTISFGIAQFKNGRQAGGVFAVLLSILTVILYFNFIFDKIFL